MTKDDAVAIARKLNNDARTHRGAWNTNKPDVHPTEQAEYAIAAALIAAYNAGLERAAKTHDPGDRPMCDCIRVEGEYWQQRCDCQNRGDLEIAQAWCVAKNSAAAIRALKLPETPI